MTDRAVRHSRRGLIIPFLIFGLALAVWSGWWLYLSDQVRTRLDAQVAALRSDGWVITHDGTDISGYPFRVRVALPQADILAPSGHGIAAPQLVAEANAWNPDHWVMIASDGLTLTRAAKGRVKIGSDGVRLSISDLRARFPDLRVEMIRPTFTPLPGAEPFPIASARHIQLETRPAQAPSAGDDDVDVLFRLVEAKGRPGGPVEGATQQGELSLDLETTIIGASHLRAIDGRGVFAAFTDAGGRFAPVRGEIRAGDSRARLSSETLSADVNGRLTGTLAVVAEQPMQAIAGLAGSQTGAVNRPAAAGAAVAAGAEQATQGEEPVELTIDFRDGRTWLGPFALAPAPKLF